MARTLSFASTTTGIIATLLALSACTASESLGNDGIAEGGGAGSGGAGGQAGASGSGGASGSSGTPPTVSVLDAHPVLQEKHATVFVVLSHTWTQPVAVQLETQDDTAFGDASGSGDYVPKAGQVVVAAGSLTGSTQIEVNTTYKTLTLDTSLSKAFKTKITQPTAGATIDDGDGVVTLAQAGMVIETPLASKLFDGDIIPDFNGDQKADMVLTGQGGKAAVLLTPGTTFQEAGHIVVNDAYLDGARAFSYPVSFNATSGVPDEFVTGDNSMVYDVNQDSLTDLLVVGENKAHFLYGHSGVTPNFTSGDPRLSDGQSATELTGIYFGYGASALQTGDWDGDGIFDWGQANFYSSAPGTGGSDLFKGFYGEAGPYPGVFTPTQSFSFTSGTSPVGQSSLFNGAFAGGRADLDSDGIDDIVFVGLAANDGQFGGNYLYVRFGTAQKLSAQSATIKGTLDGTNGFQVSNDASTYYAGGSFSIQDTGDVNGDNTDDLVLTGGGAPLTVIFGRKFGFAKGSYSSLQEMGSEAAFFNTDEVHSARIGDLNKDGVGDIVFITENKLRVVWGKKDLTGKDIFGTQYPEVGEIDIDPSSGLDTVSMVGDVDGDGTSDVVILSRTHAANTGGALVLFGKTLTRFLGGPELEPRIPR